MSKIYCFSLRSHESNLDLYFTADGLSQEKFGQAIASALRTAILTSKDYNESQNLYNKPISLELMLQAPHYREAGIPDFTEIFIREMEGQGFIFYRPSIVIEGDYWARISTQDNEIVYEPFTMGLDKPETKNILYYLKPENR